jgi:RNA polymerase sigma-70 factor (ECF subfamily)
MLAWESRSNFHPGPNAATSMQAWLLRIMHNAFISHIRRSKRRRMIAMKSDTKDDTADVECHDADQEIRVFVNEVETYMQRMAPDLRNAILAVKVDGMSYREAGIVLGVPESTIRSRLHVGRAQLKSFANEGCL